jgi:integrase
MAWRANAGNGKWSAGRLPPEAFIFPNAGGGFMDTANYRSRILKPLAEKLGIEKLNFQIMRRTMATQAQNMGSARDIQAHLRHSRADTAANEYIQALPESEQKMAGSVYLMLAKGKEEKTPITNWPQKATMASGELLVSC